MGAGCTVYDAWKTTEPEPTPDPDDPTGLCDPRQCDWCPTNGPEVRHVQIEDAFPFAPYSEDCCPACLLEQHSMLICSNCGALVDKEVAVDDCGPVCHERGGRGCVRR